MDVILHQLGELLLKAIPTFLLVVLLSFYLKSVFFRPLEKVLRQRYDATEGARKAAEESMQRAAAKVRDYEAALQAARSELYQAQEQAYKQLQETASAQIAEARRQADQTTEQARQRIAQE